MGRRRRRPPDMRGIRAVPPATTRDARTRCPRVETGEDGLPPDRPGSGDSGFRLSTNDEA